MCSRFSEFTVTLQGIYANFWTKIRVNLIRINFMKRQFPRRSLSRALISATLFSIVLDTLETFLTPKKEEYNIISRVEIRQ